jgi:hypothetical protein
MSFQAGLMGSLMLKLVKDFHEYQFVYYWIDSHAVRVSPNLPTPQFAEEWVIHHYFSEYNGKERRRTIFDRRYDGSKVKLEGTQIFFSKRKPSVKGRRSTDLPIAIDLDLSVEKLHKLRSG